MDTQPSARRPRGPRTVTLLIPTLNEIDGMRAVMPRVRPDWVDQILVVDGGSTDGTAEWARAQGYDVLLQSRPGLRQALTEAMAHARGDIIVTFSPDGNSLPEVIPALVDQVRAGWDLVIASRYADGARSEDDDWVTAFGNWFFTRTLNWLFTARYTDVMVMLRAFRRGLVAELELDRDDGYQGIERLVGTQLGWEPLMCIRAAKRRLRTADVPAVEPPRIGGTRKLQIVRWGLAYVLLYARERFGWK